MTFATDSAREAAAEWLGLGESVRRESVLLDAEGGVRPLVVDVGPDWWRIAYLDGGTIDQDNRPLHAAGDGRGASRAARLDAGFTVPGLPAGIFGTEKWMKQDAANLGRKGGSATAEATRAAARASGKKDGRSRKETSAPSGWRA